MAFLDKLLKLLTLSRVFFHKPLHSYQLQKSQYLWPTLYNYSFFGWYQFLLQFLDNLVLNLNLFIVFFEVLVMQMLFGNLQEFLCYAFLSDLYKVETLAYMEYCYHAYFLLVFMICTMCWMPVIYLCGCDLLGPGRVLNLNLFIVIGCKSRAVDWASWCTALTEED